MRLIISGEREEEAANGITAREVPEGFECVHVEKERHQQETQDVEK